MLRVTASQAAGVQPAAQARSKAVLTHQTSSPHGEDRRRQLAGLLCGVGAAALVGLAAPLLPPAAHAVSGGGGTGTGVPLAFSNQSGQDFSGRKLYKADLRGANFDKAKLNNANLFGAIAKGTSFKGASFQNSDLESVDFENAALDDAILTGAQLTSANLKGVTIEGSDWSDVILRKDVQKKLCSIAAGTNSQTGVDTRESLLCS